MWRALLVPLVLGACAATSAPSAEPTPATTAPSASGSLRTTGPPDEVAGFSSSVRLIGPRLRQRMRFSHHVGCPVPLRDLRYLQLRYIGFDGQPHRGELVVHRRYADAVVEVFDRLYTERWPIRRMRLVDDYRGDDEASMAANNTSGYNCRTVAGTDTWSDHAYGRAIDINPVQNPYVTGEGVHPPAGASYATLPRTVGLHLPSGAIHAGDAVVRAFARVGWSWGGSWSSEKDYQHFYAGDPD